MSKRAKSKNFKKNVTKVKELVKGTPTLKELDPQEIIDSMPEGLLNDAKEAINSVMGGDGFAKYISDFLELFKVLSTNIELNTAGIGALANNSIHFNNLLIEVKSKLSNIEKLLGELNAK